MFSLFNSLLYMCFVLLSFIKSFLTFLHSFISVVLCTFFCLFFYFFSFSLRQSPQFVFKSKDSTESSLWCVLFKHYEYIF